jgi:ribose transport system permease protein
MIPPQLEKTAGTESALAPAKLKPRFPWANWVIGVQGPLVGLVLLCVIFSLTTNVFLSVRNALNILDQVTVLGILAVGMTAVIVTGGIDLSVGSVLALSMMIMGWLHETWDVPLPVGIVLALLAGLACG